MQKTNYYKRLIPSFALDTILVGRFYDTVIQRRLHRFKFAHNTVDSVYFKSIFLELISESGVKNNSECIITYPPISLKDRIFRWPNHAKKLAQICAEILDSKNILCPFQKKFFAGHQSRRNKNQRKHIRSEYTLKKHFNQDFQGKEVIFIDDIITTGHTAHALARLLKTLWATKITWLFLASQKI